MRLALALLFSIVAAPRLCAYTGGQYITVDSMFYRVNDAENFTLTFTGTTRTGSIVVPDTVFDGQGNCFTVTCAELWTGNSSQLRSISTNLKQIEFKGNTLKSFDVKYTTGRTFILPASLEKIDGYSVDNNKYIIAEGNTHFTSDSRGILYNADKTTLIGVPSDVALEDSTLEVPEGVTRILSKFTVPAIKTLKLPASLAKIYVFQAPSLQSVIVAEGNTHFYTIDGALVQKSDSTLLFYPSGGKDETCIIPDDVRRIGRDAFTGCSNIKVINTNKVTTITNISYSPNLRKLELCDSLDSYYAFSSYWLSTIEVSPGNKSFKVVDGVLFSKDGTTLYQYPAKRQGKTYRIPSGVTTIASCAFDCVNLDTLIVPSSVKNLGREVFRLTKIGNLVFEPSSELSDFPNSTFSSATVGKMNLPAGLKTLSSIPSKLKELSIPEDSKVDQLPENCFDSGIESIIIKNDAITSIPAGAFQNCKNLKEVVLPASLKTIGKNAFMDCTNLESVTFAEGTQITTLGEGCFSGSGIKEINVPQSVKTIEREAFYGCSALKTVHLSAATTSVSPEAFKHCENLSAFDVADDNPNYSAVKGYLCSKDKSTLLVFPPAKAKEDITLLPPSVTEIGDYAFYDCPNLTNVVIPKKVTKIGERAFGLCKNLRTIAFLSDEMIPDSVYNQEDNHKTFDDGSVDGMGDIKNVSISCVYSELLPQYESNAFYAKFKDIKTTFVDKNSSDEFFPLSDTRLMLVKVASPLKTYTVGGEVTDADGVSRTVNMIGDYAFEGAETEEVVLKQNVNYIGALAFMTKPSVSSSKKKMANTLATGSTATASTSSIKSIFFCNATPPSVLATTDYELSSDYNEFTSDQKIYVRPSKLAAFKAALPKYADQICYKIQDISTSTGLATFAREFDTDFSNYYDSTNTTLGVEAYVAGEQDEAGGKQYVYMESIDKQGGDINNAGYIPAGTGVLLRLKDNVTTLPDGFYYTIGEHQDSLNVDGSSFVMKGVLDSAKVVEAGEGEGVSRYVLQSGAFRHIVDGKPVTVPTHKAYLELTNASEAKPSLSIRFPDGTTTAIKDITGEGGNAKASNTARYNLAGQRLPENVRAHGVVIQGGKKILKK